MLAFDYLGPNSQFNNSNTPFTITAYSDRITGGVAQNRTDFNKTIPLESCTIDHFSSFERIRQKFHKWNAGQWLCLPINRTFDIEGSWYLDGKYQSINVLFQCHGNCTRLSDGINIDFYTLSSVANPHNGSEPEQYFL